MAEIKRLMTTADVIQDIDNRITPIYFPDEVLDKNRVGTYGWLTEALAEAMSDTVSLEQTRATDYCPELSNNEIHVNQTAKIRGVGVQRATPGSCYAVIGMLKSDVVSKGERYSDVERRFTIDRRSTILYGTTNYSLEDDILIRAVLRGNKYYYTANYTMEHLASGVMDAYLQVYEYTNTQGQELIGMVVRLLQCNYNISDQTVIDGVEFTYDGLHFEYKNKLAGFDVYYKASPTDAEYTKAKLDHYLTTAPATNRCLYYNDDESGLIKIMNNPYLGLSTNSIIRVEIRETLGSEGELTLNGMDHASFSMYQDAAYNYSGVYVYINMLTDTTAGSDGDTLTDVKKRLIDAKTRRSNITTEHDILSYINDADANIQLVKKRNDVQDRNYYMYTLIREEDGTIAPTTTKQLRLRGPVSEDDPGDFDIYRPEDRRKMIKANAGFRLNVVTNEDPDDDTDNDYVTRVRGPVNETIIVDPVAMPDIDGHDIGDVVRVRYTMTNGNTTERTYTVSERNYGTTNAITNLYKYKSTESEVLYRNILSGEHVVVLDVIEETLEDESVVYWYRVEYDKLIGYILTDVDYDGATEKFYERSFYLNNPYMMIVDDQDIASFYFNSVDSEATLSAITGNSIFPVKMIARSVKYYRNSHVSDDVEASTYTFSVIGTLNTETDELLVDEDYNIIDDTAVMCYLFFPENGTISAYLPMKITGYNSETREFTFSGSIQTNDYITEGGTLEIDEGLYRIGSTEPWNAIDYKDGAFTVYFMYKEDETYVDYETSDPIVTMLPESLRTYQYKVGSAGLILMDLVLYAEASSESTALLQINTGSTVIIDDDVSTDSWYHVTYTDENAIEWVGYITTNPAYVEYVEQTKTGGYVLMNSYTNNSSNTYDLVLEFAKFTRSPVTVYNGGLDEYGKDSEDGEPDLYAIKAFGPIMDNTQTLNDALQIILTTNDPAQTLASTFHIEKSMASYVLNNRIKMLQPSTVARISEKYHYYMDHGGFPEAETTYVIDSVPFFEYTYGCEKTVTLYDKFKKDMMVYTSLLKLTTDFEVALKFTATYGPSKYITITGIRGADGSESAEGLKDLNPTLYFKVYGIGIPVSDVYTFIYEYVRDHYITNESLFMSNICTAVENAFPSVESIKYMGVDDFDASYQQMTFHVPDFVDSDTKGEAISRITKYVPEQLNTADIRVELVETRL